MEPDPFHCTFSTVIASSIFYPKYQLYPSNVKESSKNCLFPLSFVLGLEETFLKCHMATMSKLSEVEERWNLNLLSQSC